VKLLGVVLIPGVCLSSIAVGGILIVERAFAAASAVIVVVIVVVVAFAVAEIIAEELIIDKLQNNAQTGNDADHEEYFQQYLKEPVFGSPLNEIIQYHIIFLR
jgi:thiol:disulfide interchange protein